MAPILEEFLPEALLLAKEQSMLGVRRGFDVGRREEWSGGAVNWIESCLLRRGAEAGKETGQQAKKADFVWAESRRSAARPLQPGPSDLFDLQFYYPAEEQEGPKNVKNGIGRRARSRRAVLEG